MQARLRLKPGLGLFGLIPKLNPEIKRIRDFIHLAFAIDVSLFAAKNIFVFVALTKFVVERRLCEFDYKNFLI